MGVDESIMGVDEQQQQVLCKDVFYDVMRCMDGVTLAVSGCVSSGFRSASKDEGLWEDLCAKQWPSTRDPNAKAMISAVGGFQKLFSECSRLISTPEWMPGQEQKMGTQEFAELACEKEFTSCSSSSFVSMVDVVFKGQPLFSKFVDGIPGADDFAAWFSSCPFRVDLIQSTFEDDDSCSNQLQSCTVGILEDDEPFIECERKYSRAWKDIWDHMKLSWILINKETKQMANVSSWSPVVGQRHWPTDRDFLLRYGSILAHSLPKPVECSIILKCRILCRRATKTGEFKASLKLTELSMQLKEVMGGEHLNGRDSLPVLHRAVASSKSRDHQRVLGAHRNYLKLQNELKMQEMRHEWHLDLYAFMIIFAALMFLAYLLRC